MEMRLIGGRQVRWAVVVQLGALLGCLLLSTLVYRYFEVCDRESGGALAEFPMFENADIEPKPDDGDPEDCYATFSTMAPAESVISYYRQQLAAHGWKENLMETRTHDDYYEANRGNLCIAVIVTPSKGALGVQRVGLNVQYTQPGDIPYPLNDRC